ncbi:TPA: class IIb bacteriocin, lactobin A/cerein 7B family [Streptococcus suis]
MRTDSFYELDDIRLMNVEGGKPNIGSSIGACVAGVLTTVAFTGPITLGAGAVVCIGTGVGHYIGG